MKQKILINIFTVVAVVTFAWPLEMVSAAQPPVIATPVRWLTVTSPNGGEVLTAGSVHRITWNASANIDRIYIGYKACLSCLSWIATNIPNTGYYDWNVSVGSTTNTQFRIQVIGYDSGAGTVVDVSDANFTVNQPPTPTRTPTKTRTPTITKTPTVTRTPTSTKTPTKTVTSSITPTATFTDTITPSATVTITPSDTPTPTPSETPSFTPTPELLPPGDGMGLTGAYFDNDMDIDGAPLFTRIDPQVYFAWDEPVAGNVPDDFTARWTGQIEARSSESYVFYVDADDQARVWIDGELYIDYWDDPQGDHGGAPISLTRGQKYDLQIDFRDTGGDASIYFYWYTISGSIEWEVVPMQQLYPAFGELPDTATPTSTSTQTPTSTPSSTPTVTFTRTPTITVTRTVSRTPTSTFTRTLTRTPTNTITLTATGTSTVTRTVTRTVTATRTRTSTPTLTDTPTEVSPSPISSWISVNTPNGGEILTLGDIYSITWESSGDFELVDILIGYRYTCEGCSLNWNLEWSEGLVPNSGSYDWTVQAEDPSNKEFIVLVQGEQFNGSGYDVVASDESDAPFTVEIPDIPTSTQTFTPTPMPTTDSHTFRLMESYNLRVKFGDSVNTAGDVNGDGFDDVLIGAPAYWGTQVEEGAAFLYFGTASDISTIPDWSVQSDQRIAYMGDSVGSAGDVNGDGFDDVLVGAYQFSMGETGEGVVFAYYGSPDGPSTTADWIGQGNQEGGGYGWSVSGAGDVNNDGYDDVIIGARSQDNGQTNEGRAYLYLGSATGLDSTPAWIGEIDEPNAGFGYSVSKAADVNGDGYDDVLITSYSYVSNQMNGGKAYVFMGGPGGLAATALWIGESNAEGYGYDGSGAGDVNGDGYADILIGAPTGYDGPFEGKAYLYLGSIEGPGLTPDWIAEDGTASSLFGGSVSSAGDFNDDGYDDIVVGDEIQETVFLYLGSAEGPGTIADETYVNDSSGSVVGVAGDVNNDGYDDFLAGAPAWNAFDGRALLFFGWPMNIPGPVIFTPTPVNTQTVTPTSTATFTRTVTPTATFTRTVTPTGTFTVTPTRTLTRTSTATRTLTNTVTSTRTQTATPLPSCSLILIDRVRFNSDNFEARVRNDNQHPAYLTDATLSWSPSPLTGSKYFDYAQFGSIYHDPAESIVDSPVNIPSFVPDLPIAGNGTQISWIADFSNTTFYGTWSVSLTFNFPDWGDCTLTGSITNNPPTPTNTRTPTSTATFTETPAETPTPLDVETATPTIEINTPTSTSTRTPTRTPTITNTPFCTDC